MKPRLFLNRDVASIVGITPRQVLHWTEKDLIIPAKEALNPGDKRGYNYTNLLEFGLCKTLFTMGLGVYAVKWICRDLRRTGGIESWAEDYEGHFGRLAKEYKNWFERYRKEHEGWQPVVTADGEEINLKIWSNEKLIKKILKPKGPVGVLFYCFNSEGSGRTIVIPSHIKFALSVPFLEKEILPSKGVIMVDLGKIKQEIDKKIKALG